MSQTVCDDCRTSTTGRCWRHRNIMFGRLPDQQGAVPGHGPAPTKPPPRTNPERVKGVTMTEDEKAELEQLRTAMAELNRLRSNVIATQSASWSNAMYPMVAILNRAGYELIRDVTPEDMADHMLCYGGAGGSPDHLGIDTRKGGPVASAAR